MNPENVLRDENGNPVCGLSWDDYHNYNQMAPNYKFHFAPESELKANGGVCSACASKIRSHHSKFQHGRAETPVSLDSIRNHIYSSAEEHIGVSIVDGTHPTVDFPFHELDPAVAEASPDACIQAADLLEIIFAWCWRGRCSMRSATAKFSAFMAGLRPDLLENRTYQQIADEIGVSKGMMSKVALEFQDRYGMKFSRSYSDASRQSCSRAAKIAHAKRKQAPAPTLPDKESIENKPPQPSDRTA